MVFMLNTRKASVNTPIICLCNVLGAEQNAPARSKGPGCILWEPPPARCRVPTGEPHHGIRAPRFVPGSSQSPAPLPRPPAPRRAPLHSSLPRPAAARGSPFWGPPGQGAAMLGATAAGGRHNGVPRTHHGAVQGSGPALPAWPPPRPRFKAPPPAPPCPPPSPGPWACPGEGGSGGAMPAAEGEGDEGDREPSASCGFCSECKQSITSPIKNIYSGYRSLPKMPFFFPPVFNKADFGV